MSLVGLLAGDLDLFFDGVGARARVAYQPSFGIENADIGDGADVIALGDGGSPVADIHFAQDDVAFAANHVVEDRGDLAAGAAPGGMEIDDGDFAGGGEVAVVDRLPAPVFELDAFCVDMVY